MAASRHGGCWKVFRAAEARRVKLPKADVEGASGSPSRRARCSTMIARHRVAVGRNQSAQAAGASRHVGAGSLHPGAQAPRTGVRQRTRGTGKTWLAVAYAVMLFERKDVDGLFCRVPPSKPANGWASCGRHAREGRSVSAADL